MGGGWACVFVLVSCLAGFGATASATQAQRDPAATAATRPSVTWDAAAHLADPVELQSTLKKERQTIEGLFADGVGPLNKAEGHLTLANWLLATPTARPATRWLIGLHSRDDLRTIAAYAQEAQVHLDQAQKLLKADEVKKLRGPAKARRRELSKASRLLKSFAALLAEAATDEKTEAGRSAWAAAALKLSIARESGDENVAACALLWQTFAWELAGRRDRALTSLPDALQPPEQLPYDFLCRLLRCRIILDDGKQTAAFVLTTQMLGASRRWLRGWSGQRATSGSRLVALLHNRVGRAWMGHFRAAGQTDGLGAVQAMLIRVQDELFGADDKPATVYFLDATVPLLVIPAEIEWPAALTSMPRPASAPATQPGSLQEPTSRRTH